MLFSSRVYSEGNGRGGRGKLLFWGLTSESNGSEGVGNEGREGCGLELEARSKPHGTTYVFGVSLQVLWSLLARSDPSIKICQEGIQLPPWYTYWHCNIIIYSFTVQNFGLRKSIDCAPPRKLASFSTNFYTEITSCQQNSMTPEGIHRTL